MSENTQKKMSNLQDLLKSFESVLVCFSGGVDSTFLLKAALDELGPEKAVGFMVRSVLQPTWVSSEARCVGESIGARIEEIDDDLLLLPDVKENRPERCYSCKREIMRAAMSRARALGLKQVVEGMVVDDLEDNRPGRRALEEMGVGSPLVETGFTKEEVREASKSLGLSTWNNPSNTCLATRFPTGVKITADKLERVAKSEFTLREEGFKIFRVRDHGNLARIELAPVEFPAMFREGRLKRVVAALNEAGFKYVSMDLGGYRTGNMDNNKKDEKQKEG